MSKLVEGRDFYKDKDGNTTFTEAYLLSRGHCCYSGCRHCPYELPVSFENVPVELQIQPPNNSDKLEDMAQKYLDELEE